MKIKHNFKILEDWLTISGNILETIFEEWENRWDRKENYTKDWKFYILSIDYPEFKPNWLYVHWDDTDHNNIMCVKTYKTEEEAKQVMERINEFTVEELKEWDIVYVSDESKEDTLTRKKERIFLWKIWKINICVSRYSENWYKKWGHFETNNRKYIVKKPVEEEKTERKLILTDSE